MSRKIQIEFVKVAGFDRLRNIEIVLLVFVPFLQRKKKQITLSEKKINYFEKVSPSDWLTNSSTFNKSSLFKTLARNLPKLVLVPKRQPGVQMDLSSSDLPEEVQKLLEEKSVKKIIYHV